MALFLFMRIFVRSFKFKAAQKGKSFEKVGIFRRLMASAVGLISPDLQQWMLKGDDQRNTLFYDQLVAILRSSDLERADNQTQREFAETSMLHFRKHDQSQLIERVIRNVTQRFYEVRFGDRELPQNESEKLFRDLESLKSVLAEPRVAAQR